MQEEAAHFRELRQFVKQYDEDKSGNLDATELAKCLKAYSDARQWTAVPAELPTEEETNLVLQVAGKHTKGRVDASEIQYALDVWHSYISNRRKIEQVFEKYDTNHSKKLEFDQLKNYLTELNEGHPPKVNSQKKLLANALMGFCIFKPGRRGACYHARDQRRRRSQQGAADHGHFSLVISIQFPRL